MSFNKFCMEYSGVTREAASNFLLDEQKRNIFFRPYKPSKPFNPFFRAATVVTAPICSLILALELALKAVAYVGKAILSLAMKDFGKPWNNLKHSGNCLYAMCLNLLVAAISPVVNLVDLIGGAIVTATRSPSWSMPLK